jgi:hypothetical protein
MEQLKQRRQRKRYFKSTRVVAAYEHGGIARFAEAAVRELEAKLELERRRRRIGNSVEGQS